MTSAVNSEHLLVPPTSPVNTCTMSSSHDPQPLTQKLYPPTHLALPDGLPDGSLDGVCIRGEFQVLQHHHSTQEQCRGVGQVRPCYVRGSAVHLQDNNTLCCVSSHTPPHAEVHLLVNNTLCCVSSHTPPRAEVHLQVNNTLCCVSPHTPPHAEVHLLVNNTLCCVSPHTPPHAEVHLLVNNTLCCVSSHTPPHAEVLVQQRLSVCMQQFCSVFTYLPTIVAESFQDY